MTNIEGLYLKSFDPSKIKINSKVQKFYNALSLDDNIVSEKNRDLHMDLHNDNKFCLYIFFTSIHILYYNIPWFLNNILIDTQ